MPKRQQSTAKKTAIPLRHPRLLALLALAMWVAGPGISAGAATLGYGHLKILILAAGLVMMDLAAAITVSLMWFGSRHYIEPLSENEAENEYCYRAGYRDATLRFLQPGPGLQLVRPTIPVPAQMPRGYAVEQKGPVSM